MHPLARKLSINPLTLEPLVIKPLSIKKWATVLLAIALVVTSRHALAETVLITGANQGIGLEFARQYAARGWTVIATHRRPTTPEELAQLAAKYPKVRIERMDVTDTAQIEALGAKLKGVPDRRAHV